MQTKYLIIGSSHAGLTAAEEIRMHDAEGSLTMVTMEDCFPYSPTILPYIIEGKVEEKLIYLRDEKYFQENNITFLKGKKVIDVDTKASKVSLDDGSDIAYEKLLVTTGGEPTIPPVPGLKEANYLVLQTMEDVHKINQAAETAKTAVVMGTGLVGMHAAEALGKKGLQVELIRGRRRAVLPNYFDSDAGKLIHQVFLDNGIHCDLDNHVKEVESVNGKSKVILDSGEVVETELLVVGTGVKPRMDFLGDSGIQADKGILVDNMMRTSVGNVWAAGDVAQTADFYGKEKVLTGILPDAYEQGKIAGLDMAGDEAVNLAFDEIGGQAALSYPGGISMNTFNFYGNKSFSVGLSLASEEDGYETDKMLLPTSCMYQKLVFDGDFLVGAVGINVTLDPGVIVNIIRLKIDLKGRKSEFASNPLDMSRRIMWDSWRGSIKTAG